MRPCAATLILLPLLAASLHADELILYPPDAQEGEPGTIHMQVEVIAAQPIIDFPAEAPPLNAGTACKRANATFRQFFPDEPAPYLESVLLTRIPPEGDLARWFWIVTILPVDNRPTDYLGNVMEADVFTVAVGMDGTAFIPALRVGTKY